MNIIVYANNKLDITIIILHFITKGGEITIYFSLSWLVKQLHTVELDMKIY